MKSYIITRFSIYDYNYKSFVMNTNKSKKDYKESLFSKKRLDFKFKVFTLVTLPSITNQTNQNFEWYIYSSTFLPNEYKQKLLNLTAPYLQIKCIFVSSLEEFFKFKDLQHLNYKKEPYCTIRLDDDDGLCKNFIQILNENKEFHEENVIVTFLWGIRFSIKENQVIYRCKRRQRYIGCGLTGIGMNIYNCGNHATIGERYKAIPIEEMRDIYMICTGNWCDSKRKIPF